MRRILTPQAGMADSDAKQGLVSQHADAVIGPVTVLDAPITIISVLETVTEL